jgi:hypothetical protein
MIPPEELRHVMHGPRADERPTGAGLVTVSFHAPDVQGVLDRSRSVMSAVLRAGGGPWPPLQQWTERLPAWFVQACAPERTQDEKQQWLTWWRGLDLEGRAVAERDRRWSLDDWLYYLEPDERQWYWWDAAALSSSEGTVELEVPGWPTPLGALKWLLHAAGADAVTADE